MTGRPHVPLRAALSGCGGISEATLAIAGRDFRVVALYDPDSEAAGRLASQYEVGSVVDRFEDLLTPDIHFVIVNGPNHVHAEQTLAAVAAGKPVLVQKPMARNAAEAESMVEAARAANVRLGVTMVELGCPVNVEIRRMLRAGALGEPVMIEGTIAHSNYRRSPPPTGNWRLDPEKVGGGAFAQLAIHRVSLASWILDQAVTEVGAMATRQHTPFEEETSVAVARFAGGVMATFTASWAADASRFSIVGTEGSVEVVYDRMYCHLKHPHETHLLGSIQGDVIHEIGPMATHQARRKAGRALEVHGRFARSLIQDDPYPYPGSRGLQDMRVLDAFHRSLRTGRVEPVAGSSS